MASEIALRLVLLSLYNTNVKVFPSIFPIPTKFTKILGHSSRLDEEDAIHHHQDSIELKMPVVTVVKSRAKFN